MGIEQVKAAICRGLFGFVEHQQMLQRQGVGPNVACFPGTSLPPWPLRITNFGTPTLFLYDRFAGGLTVSSYRFG